MGGTRSDTFKCVETSFWTLRAVSFLESQGGPAGRKVNQLAWVHQLPTELHSLQIPLSDAHFSPSLTRSFQFHSQRCSPLRATTRQEPCSSGTQALPPTAPPQAQVSRQARSQMLVPHRARGWPIRCAADELTAATLLPRKQMIQGPPISLAGCQDATAGWR